MHCQTLRVLFPDQLSRSISCLADLDASRDVVLMAEVFDEATLVRHHAKKLVFLFSAMRHFARALEDQGVDVDYLRLDAPGNSGSLRTELVRAVHRHRPQAVVLTAPCAYRLQREVEGWEDASGVPVEIREDDRFFCTPGMFAAWHQANPDLSFRAFYQWMRQRTGLLMAADGAPVGGRWHFAGLRRRLRLGGGALPATLRVEPDDITRDVMALVANRFSQHFGAAEPFWFAVTATDAERLFDYYRTQVLPRGESAHQEGGVCFALLAMLLNAGLLEPRAACLRLEADCRAGRLSPAATEGAVRLILGWREFLRGLYGQFMPGLAEKNNLEAYGPLPAFYWTGETEMNCLHRAISHARDEGFADNLQRIIITGGFALLAGVAPPEFAEWCLTVYADTHDWLELPLVQGPVTFASGTTYTAYPWVLDGRLINRCTRLCQSCRYDPDLSTGDLACPFNLLFWSFLARHRALLAHHRPFARAYRHLDALPADAVATLQIRTEQFLNSLA